MRRGYPCRRASGYQYRVVKVMLSVLNMRHVNHSWQIEIHGIALTCLLGKQAKTEHQAQQDHEGFSSRHVIKCGQKVMRDAR